MNTEDRRTPDTTRIPFEGLVEVGGASGPTFEAQAVNVSEDGLQVRSAYLPDPGQPLTCRFDVGRGQSVIAAGEVAWAHGTDRGGELGIRFTEMDPESIDALKRACGEGSGPPAATTPGAKVRLHIDGLASPMRAKIRDSRSGEITVGSELGFLQVGKQLELEDPQSGTRRPANIDSVDVVVDPSSHVPQLVVTLRYTDASASASTSRSVSPAVEESPAAVEARHSEEAATDAAESLQMKSSLARNVAQIGPALERLASQAKTTVALLARRRRERAAVDESATPRRTTAPPLGGGLHTSGRRVVRGDAGEPAQEVGILKAKTTRRKVALASAVMMAAIAGAIAIKKSHHEPTQTPTSVAVATPSAAAPVASAGAPEPAPSATPIPSSVEAAFPPSVSNASAGQIAGGNEDSDAQSNGHKKHARVAPFSNGPVHHGNVMHLRLDGPIESLEGAQQPTGFVVKVPGRRSLEAAAPLASRDSRIAAIKVANEPAGAELTVTFRDGVPNYRVSAKGEILVISLAQVGQLDAAEETVAKKDQAGGKAPKHAKRDRDPSIER